MWIRRGRFEAQDMIEGLIWDIGIGIFGLDLDLNLLNRKDFLKKFNRINKMD